MKLLKNKIKYKNINKLRKEVEIYRRNFRSIYKNQILLKNMCDRYIERFMNDIINHGPSYTLSLHKEFSRHMTQVSLYQESCLNQEVWIKTTSEGYPSFLFVGMSGRSKRRFMKVDHKVQGLLTLLNMYRLLKKEIDPSIESIIEPYPYDEHLFTSDYISDLKRYIPIFFKENKLSIFSDEDKVDFPNFQTSKSGPNGPAVGLGSIKDAMALVGHRYGLNPSLIKFNLNNSLDSLAQISFTEEGYKSWRACLNESLTIGRQMFPSRNDFNLSRLHFLSEYGGKTRVIVIPDIWSQSVLSGIHDKLMKLLYSLRSDGTNSHARVADSVRDRSKSHPVFCADLKASTDYMPAKLQKEVLSYLLQDYHEFYKPNDDLKDGEGRKYFRHDAGDHWYTVIKERDILNPHDGSLVRYERGQPMGLLSSWAAMALTHHIIIQFSIMTSSFGRVYYRVIGDDMAIGSLKAYEEYKDILDGLQMPISLEKSIESTQMQNVGEIAKRLYRNGVEISPIPPRILKNATGSFVGFVEFLEVFSARTSGPNLPEKSDTWIQDSVKELFQNSTLLNNQETLITLTCPFLKDVSRLSDMPITGLCQSIPSQWNEKVLPMLKGRFDQFITERASRLIMEKSMSLGVISPSGTVSSKPFVVSEKGKEIPIYRAIRESQLERLKLLYFRANTVYPDDEDDAFAKSAVDQLIDILSLPDPLKADSIYLDKDQTRLRKLSSLILQFYNEQKAFVGKKPTKRSAR